MEHTDESVDVESRDLHSTKGTDTYDLESNADEDDSYSGSSGDESSETESSETGEDASDNIGAAVHSEVNFDSITSDEIRAMEFATVSEAYEFYYRYGKCKGFAIRKASSRIKELDGNKVTQMKQFVCNRHGLREKKHLTRLDRKVEHRRLSRTNCEARFRVQYRKQKDRYVVTAFVECHNHELTPARFVHLHPVYLENVKDNPEFLDGFQKAMYSNFTKDEFEEYWSELIKETEVEQHPWVVKTYENRSLWATGYLRDRFFGRIRTTSQCEAVNAIIKTYVRTKGCIFEFMHNFDQVLRDYRNNELEADFKSKFTVPVLTTQLRVIESDAANTYTAEIFKEVKEQILKAGALIVKHKSDHGDTKIYTLTKFCNDTYERKVVFDGTTLQCSCKLFDSRGVPCSHIFYVMKDEHVDHIPRPLVLSRWTKDAKIEYLNNMECNGDVESNVVEEARFGAYCSAFTSFCKEAAKKNGVYGQILDDIMKLQKKYCINDDPIIGTQNPAVGDPVAVKSKGAPKKKKKEPKSVRRCGKCNATTHNARTYSEGTQKATEPIVDLQSVSISDAISQMDEKKKRKATCNVDRSVQKKGSRPPIHRGAKATVTTQADTNGCYNQMHFQAQMDVTGTSRHLNAMCGVQPVMPMVPHMFQPMHLQPVYPMYGMSVGQTASSCYGMLQQSVGQSSRSCYSLLQQVEKAATDD
ncbi:unnamed protein product [Trifolium pratense]|uniref:Uncharacterized protein n=1 Tax=Trifolium pratense TaxID=57577 RepID=A0ACB0LRG8_TRIPR|nr:unnamed protein product [Trifolium pratense]